MGVQDLPVFFWRPHEENGYLGQWYSAPLATPSPIDQDQTITFQNCETYMMYQKAILFNDPDVAQEILKSADDPKLVKALGRTVKGFTQTVWDEKKFEIVLTGNLEKFRQNPELKELLLATEGRELVEASPMDRVWGIGFGAKNALKNRHRWGQNLLGRVLMQVREELLSERDPSEK